MKHQSCKILVIEDDQNLRDGIVTVLRKENHQVADAADGVAGSRMFAADRPDLVITDLKLPGKGGLQLLGEFTAASPGIPVIIISAYGTIDLAVNALKAGARDFIPKPFSIDELKNKVQLAISKTAEGPAPPPTSNFHGLIGADGSLKPLVEQIRRIAQVESPVLITGESGTGKELVAQAIHRESSRARQRFLAVNCGALTDTLLESELFGHEKGAFTGATRRHLGLFEQADDGTILLDEIGEISPAMQVKLLRVLQRQVFLRVGGTTEISTDVRIIAATNRNLTTAIESGDFREDLYFRLNVLPVDIPPLRERQADLPALIDYITNKKCLELGRSQPRFSDEAQSALARYPWPGNIRELENFLERLLIFTEDQEIQPETICLQQPEKESPVPNGKLTDVLEETEIAMIRQALRDSGGVKQQAARRLGIKTSTLYYKMEKYGLDVERDD